MIVHRSDRVARRAVLLFGLVASCGRIGFDVATVKSVDALEGVAPGIDALAEYTDTAPKVDPVADAAVTLDVGRVLATDGPVAQGLDAGFADVAPAPDLLASGPDGMSVSLPQDLGVAMMPAVDAPTFPPANFDQRDPADLPAPVVLSPDVAPDILPAGIPDAPESPDVVATPDVAMPDVASAGCLSRYPGAFFCEDFENGIATPVTAYGYSATPNGSVTGQAATVHTGGKAAYLVAGDVETTWNTRSAFFHKDFLAPVSSGGLYARTFFYIPSGFSVTSFVVLQEFLDSGPNRTKEVIGAGDAIDFRVDTDNAAVTSAGGKLPRDRWFCLEVSMNVAGKPNGTAEFRLDGVSEATVTRARTTAPGGWIGFRFGLIADANTTGARAYVDDVVISTMPIGCN